jgi:hypothetical protein
MCVTERFEYVEPTLNLHLHQEKLRYEIPRKSFLFQSFDIETSLVQLYTVVFWCKNSIQAMKSILEFLGITVFLE